MPSVKPFYIEAGLAIVAVVAYLLEICAEFEAGKAKGESQIQ
jgi:hypothetical protein